MLMLIQCTFLAINANYAPNFEKVDGAYCFWSVRGCVRGWVRACVTLFVPTVTFKPLKLVLKFHMWIPHRKIANPCFFSFPSCLPFWSYGPLKIFEKNLVSRISQKVFKLEA